MILISDEMKKLISISENSIVIPKGVNLEIFFPKNKKNPGKNFLCQSQIKLFFLEGSRVFR